MSMWEQGKRGRRFLPGRDAPREAQQAALACAGFSRDDEEDGLLTALNVYHLRKKGLK